MQRTEERAASGTPSQRQDRVERESVLMLEYKGLDQGEALASKAFESELVGPEEEYFLLER